MKLEVVEPTTPHELSVVFTDDDGDRHRMAFRFDDNPELAVVQQQQAQRIFFGLAEFFRGIDMVNRLKDAPRGVMQ